MVPVVLSPLFITLLIAFSTSIILSTKKIKNHCLFWNYCNFLSVKRKRTLSFPWEFAIVTVFIGQPKRETFSFRLNPSLFRGELKTQIKLSFWEKAPKPYISPPFLSSPKKMICIHVAFWALSKSALDRCYLEKWLSREDRYTNQAFPVLAGAKPNSSLPMGGWPWGDGCLFLPLENFSGWL